jgi:ABC-type nitrate/sulfonate/bicarbonate transport system substrate-binding protein
MADATIAARIDAGTLDAENAARARSRSELRKLADTFDSIAPRFVSGVWFSTPDWGQKNPELATRFVAAMRKAAIWGNAHPSEAVKIYANFR